MWTQAVPKVNNYDDNTLFLFCSTKLFLEQAHIRFWNTVHFPSHKSWNRLCRWIYSLCYVLIYFWSHMLSSKIICFRSNGSQISYSLIKTVLGWSSSPHCIDTKLSYILFWENKIWILIRAGSFCLLRGKDIITPLSY